MSRLLGSESKPSSVHDGIPDANWLRERDESFVYSTRWVENPELVQVHDRVYVLPETEVCAAETMYVAAKSGAVRASLDPLQ